MQTPTKIILGIFFVLIIGAVVVSSKHTGSLIIPREKQGDVNNIEANKKFSSDELSAAELPVLAQAMPEFAGITTWWNTVDNKPLTTADLKGKVILVDFWTYSCINCIRTFPFIKTMHERYADKGLIIVGVHTPEFAFEAEPKNVEREIKKNGFMHPIALDRDYVTWNAYANHYWPAEYFFDRQGRLRYTHFGEGEYDRSEEVIRALLAENGELLTPMAVAVPTPDLSKIVTRETYFGLGRGDAFSGKTPIKNIESSLSLTDPKADMWSADGRWVFREEYAQANSVGSHFRFNVQAKKLHIVMESADAKDKIIEVYIDGKKSGETTINESRLYTIAEFPDARRHMVEIRMKDGGVRFYAATFS
ncbi:redoxin family protein [Candidatus Uhrbacteria bacterium]|nr:redoxin family protein [Candidatus Uhrbacteria bacterium]